MVLRIPGLLARTANSWATCLICGSRSSEVEPRLCGSSKLLWAGLMLVDSEGMGEQSGWARLCCINN